MLEEFKGN